MHFNITMAIGSFLVAIVVGLTGMGGGALMTPMLTVFFGVPPLTAVSSDLVAAAVMKPVGGFVHLRQGTVHLRLVGWLCLGSVPSAFCGVLVARALGHGSGVENVIQYAIGVALLIAAAGLAVRGYMALADRADQRRNRLRYGPVTNRGNDDPAIAVRASVRRTAAPGEPASVQTPSVAVRPLPTVLVGILGGLVVGMTSVGSGSLIIVALIALYPGLRANQLVGTDLVQAVPLVASAALGHILFGDFKLSVTTALLAGSIPGVYLGSRISSRAPGGLIRRVLAFVLLASALKMFGVGNLALLGILCASVVAVSLIWIVLRTRKGLPALPSREEAT